jgi:hypothetical protein
MTARYSQRKYGTFKYGTTALSQPGYAFEIDWPGNGSWPGENEASRILSLTIERGRRYFITPEGDGFEPEDTGRFGVVLDNSDGRYDPYNASSPIYDYLGPGKLFRMQVRTATNQQFPLMTGILSEPTPYEEGAIPKVRLEGTDGWQFLRDQHNQVTVGLQENVYLDEAFGLILDEARWPVLWGTDLDGGVDARPYWWVTEQSPSAALFDLSSSEMGRLWIAADGRLTFRSRHSIDTPVLTLGHLDILKDGVRLLQPLDVVRNVIQITAQPRALGALDEVWRSDSAVYIRSGETINLWAEFTLNGETVPAKNCLTPVPTTDYLVNTASDGSGTNLTGSVAVAALFYSTQAYLSITNNSASSGYITLLRVRGNPVVTGDPMRFQEQDGNSIQRFQRRTFNLESPWLQNPNVARSLARFLKGFLATTRTYLLLDLMPNPDVQFAADLGQEVHVVLPGRNIDQVFRLVYIRHEWSNPTGIVTRTRWMLEPFEAVDGNYWRVPSQVPMKVPF